MRPLKLPERQTANYHKRILKIEPEDQQEAIFIYLIFSISIKTKLTRLMS